MPDAERRWTLSDFAYDLPQERIAQTPLEKRDQSKLLVLDGKRIEDRRFFELGEYLRAGDCLVLNETRVIPARLIGVRDNGAAAEILLLKRRDLTVWEALCKPGKKLKIGANISFGPKLTAIVEDRLEDGIRLVRFLFEGVFEALLDELGETPLPPYIKEQWPDPERYQTVYARFDGSAAAPTAGLHFTASLLSDIEAMGVSLATLTLHVGLGTFRPVRAEDLDHHVMHEEHFLFPEAAARTIKQTRQNGGRIIAVGTTSARVLETVALEQNLDRLTAMEGDSRLFIRPGFDFQLTDGLVTNFHLPESTLLMLVAAFAGYEEIMQAYRHAIQHDYRFFSFGDAMLLLPSGNNRSGEMR